MAKLTLPTGLSWADLGRLARGIHGLYQAAIQGTDAFQSIITSLEPVTITSVVPDDKLGKLLAKERRAFAEAMNPPRPAPEEAPKTRTPRAPKPRGALLSDTGKRFTVIVDRRKPIQQRIDATFPDAGIDIAKLGCTVPTGTITRCRLGVFKARHDLSLREIDTFIDARKLQHAGIDELVALVAAHPQACISFELLDISKVLIADGYKFRAGYCYFNLPDESGGKISHSIDFSRVNDDEGDDGGEQYVVLKGGFLLVLLHEEPYAAKPAHRAKKRVKRVRGRT